MQEQKVLATFDKVNEDQVSLNYMTEKQKLKVFVPFVFSLLFAT